MSYNIDEKGYYGEFGGAYIPEMLYPNVVTLKVWPNLAQTSISIKNAIGVYVVYSVKLIQVMVYLKNIPMALP